MTALDIRRPAAPAHTDAALAIRPGQVMWDEYQMAALDQLGLKDASNADRAVFLHQCQRTGLDPFSRQIYMIGRPEKQRDGSWRTKYTIQTGIDGFRVNRARAERLAGVRGTLGRAVWYDHEGNEFKVWVRREPPAACEITYTVRDASGETPYTSVLQFAEYVQLKDGRPVAQWASKPAHMLEKCTEADVYRKAFPQDFAGVILDDAMPPADDAPAGQNGGRVTAADIRGRTRPQVRAEIVRDPTDASPAGEPHTPDAAAPPTPPADPAGEAQDEPDARPPAKASTGQVGIIQSHWKRLGYDDRDPDSRAERLAFTARAAGLEELATTSDLTQEQAAQVRTLLEQCKDRAGVIERLYAGTPEGGSDG
ncbi:MAG: phage recombination protein Bet [Streptosporangiaceae bacterium]|nr:phage recombination protein Bet [Streptosporangiaceae bacterium]